MKIHNGCAIHFSVSADYIYNRFTSVVIPTDFDMWEMRWEDDSFAIAQHWVKVIHLYIHL